MPSQLAGVSPLALVVLLLGVSGKDYQPAAPRIVDLVRGAEVRVSATLGERLTLRWKGADAAAVLIGEGDLGPSGERTITVSRAGLYSVIDGGDAGVDVRSVFIELMGGRGPGSDFPDRNLFKASQAGTRERVRYDRLVHEIYLGLQNCGFSVLTDTIPGAIDASFEMATSYRDSRVTPAVGSNSSSGRALEPPCDSGLHREKSEHRRTAVMVRLNVRPSGTVEIHVKGYAEWRYAQEARWRSFDDELPMREIASAWKQWATEVSVRK